MITINNLPDQNFPLKLHEKIMRKIIFIKFRTPFFFIMIFSIINLINSGWHLVNKASELQTWPIIATMFSQFEFNLDYLASLIQTAVENTPINLMAGFGVNLILVYYLIYIFKYFKRSNFILNSKKSNC